MKLSRNRALLISACLVWVFAASATRADVAWRTKFHLSEPTEIPGMVLPPGDYVVKVLNTTETRTVVVFMKDGEVETVATVLAVPDYRLKPAETSQFVYFQRGEGSILAMKSWLYPGNSWGVEFVYPREKAVLLAEKSQEPVFATEAEAKPDSKAEVVVITPEKKEIKMEEYRSAQSAPTSPAAQPAAPPARVADSTPRQLPKTGSALPLVGLMGIASLGLAAGLRLVRRLV